MGFLYWALFGLVAGMLAKFLIPGNQPGGIIATTILGILGACLGGWIGTKMGWGDVNGFDMRSMGLAVGGGILVVLLYGLLTRNR